MGFDDDLSRFFFLTQPQNIIRLRSLKNSCQQVKDNSHDRRRFDNANRAACVMLLL